MLEKVEKLKQYKLLFVEDESDLLELIKSSLNKFQANFETATNGIEGYEQYKSFKPDVIVTEIQMPQMDGLEMIEKIRNEDQNIPIYIMSGNVEMEFMDKADELNVNEYILKPFDIKIFIEKVSKDYKIKMLKGELSQVLINLINNAKDVLIEKQIKYPTIKVSTSLKEDTLIIKVEDNAGGVKEEIKNRIFEPYYTTKHKSQGTGLGLYMSKRIVTESLMGVITVNNTPHGALFEIYLKVQND